MKREHFTLLGLLAIVIAGVLYVERAAPVPSRDAARFWEKRIEAIGARPAYEEFARAVESATLARQHDEAHFFGEGLYLAEGESGLSVCDSRFSFGCFHEFLGRAIHDLGLASAAKLDKECFSVLSESPLSCQHGVGHGIVSYIGYTRENLDEALDVCAGLPRADEIGGCYGGVFMEYNMRTMLGEAGGTREDADLGAPCDSVAEPYKKACYFWQPQWWSRIVRERETSVPEEIYARVGSLCTEAPERMSRTCFEGIGNNIPPDADFDAKRARSLCEHASSDIRSQLYCKSLAANSLFVGGAGEKGEADLVCAGLSTKEHEYCLTYAHNTANILNEQTTPGELE